MNGINPKWLNASQCEIIQNIFLLNDDSLMKFNYLIEEKKNSIKTKYNIFTWRNQLNLAIQRKQKTLAVKAARKC